MRGGRTQPAARATRGNRCRSRRSAGERSSSSVSRAQRVPGQGRTLLPPCFLPELLQREEGDPTSSLAAWTPAGRPTAPCGSGTTCPAHPGSAAPGARRGDTDPAGARNSVSRGPPGVSFLGQQAPPKTPGTTGRAGGSALGQGPLRGARTPPRPSPAWGLGLAVSRRLGDPTSPARGTCRPWLSCVPLVESGPVLLAAWDDVQPEDSD